MNKSLSFLEILLLGTFFSLLNYDLWGEGDINWWIVGGVASVVFIVSVLISALYISLVSKD